MMTDGEQSASEEGISSAGSQARHDFSLVRGFQAVGATDQAASEDNSWRDALRAELEARAARFHQAVDAAIVLSNDGVVRWLGDPVARLAVGLTPLSPGNVVLADDILPATSRDIVKKRLDLWLAATTRRLLGPLFALEATQGGSEAVRDLASKLSRSFGILDREPIRRQISSLTQSERAELRKHGVRFGAYYIFMPALIKPAPRSLALHLWSLQPPGDVDALAQTLGPIAASGRTSLPFVEGISQEGYRVAGYRPCGERIVRVDVLERLAGIIRGSIGGEAGVHRKSAGFIVTGEMTSLAGCSGEQFASILRSLGFESVQMRRSEFSPSLVPTASPQGFEIEPTNPTDALASTTHDQTTPPTEYENETCVDVDHASPGGLPDPAVTTSSAQDVLRADNGDEMVAVWRRQRRTRPHRAAARKNEGPQGDSLASKPRRIAAIGSDREAGRGPRPASNQGRNENQQIEIPSTPIASPGEGPRSTGSSPRVDQSDTPRSNQDHRQPPINRDIPRLNRASGQPPRPKVDPNSPFAKLLELRTLLEEQRNKRP